MKFFKTFFKVIAPVALSVIQPEAMINTALGAVVKHATPINNQTIPILNLGLSSVVSYVRHLAGGMDPVSAVMPALQEGGMLMGMSTAIHQSLKIPMKETGLKSI